MLGLGVFFVVPDSLEFLGELGAEVFEGENGCDEIEFPQEEKDEHQSDREEIKFRWHYWWGGLWGMGRGTRGNFF